MKIIVSLNGPYEVSGEIPLSEQTLIPDEEGYSSGYQETRQFPVEETYYLCRCGQSRNKPFCDSSHKRVHFDGAETADHGDYLDQAEHTHGPELELGDIQALCASARFCDRRGGVWDRTRQSDEEESRQIAIEEVGLCPAGRLLLWDKAGKAIEPVFDPPSIAVIYDTLCEAIGPIWVRGGIPIEGADGRLYAVRNRVTLCRCGKSENKPFCDGRHTEP